MGAGTEDCERGPEHDERTPALIRMSRAVRCGFRWVLGGFSSGEDVDLKLGIEVDIVGRSIQKIVSSRSERCPC